WRRGLHAARSGRPAVGDGFHPEPYRDSRRGHLRGSVGLFSVVAAGGFLGRPDGGKGRVEETRPQPFIVRGSGGMADHGSESDAIGGSVRHIPVMLAEVLEHLAPAPGKTILDGTFGAGGYTRAILERGADVIALDRDPNAIAA